MRSTHFDRKQFFNLFTFLQSFRLSSHPTVLHSSLALFLRAIEHLNATGPVKSAPVQRIDQKLQALFDAVGLSAPLAKLSQRAHTLAAQHSAAQHSAAQHSAAQHSAAQHSAAQHSAVQHSAVQLSASQQSTYQHGAAQSGPLPSDTSGSIVTQAATPVQPFSFSNQSSRFAASRYVASQVSQQSLFQKPTLPPAASQPLEFEQTPLGGRILRDGAERGAPLTAQSQPSAITHPEAVAERHAISTVSRLAFVLAMLLVLISVSALGLRATNDVTAQDQSLLQVEVQQGQSLAVVNPANVPAAVGEEGPAQKSSATSAPLAVIAQEPNVTARESSGAVSMGANAVAPAAQAAVDTAASTSASAAASQSDVSAQGAGVNSAGESASGAAILTLPQADAAQAAAEPQAVQPTSPSGLGLLAFLSNRSAAPAAENGDASDIAQPQTAAQSPVGQALAILAPTPTPTRTPYPTFTPRPTDTPTATPTEFIPDEVPLLRIVGPSLLKPTDTPTLPPTATFTPSPTPLPITPGKLWSTFQPGPASEVDHLWIERPFLPSAPNQLASPNYQFGSTAGSRYRIHHGIDISNPLGTPVISGAEGEVIHAGLDDPALLGPYNDFYGNAVVIRLDRRLPVAGGELDVYLLYGHLNEVTVSQGQRVAIGDVVGKVGMTGIAIGPHLHVEMRLGANTYDNSVNPYLWLKPLDNSGAVAVRLLTADGRAWPGGRVSIVRYGNGGVSLWARHVETYLNDEILGPDPVWGENGAMGSVPPGSYLVIATVNGEQLRTQITVEAGHTTFVELRTTQ